MNKNRNIFEITDNSFRQLFKRMLRERISVVGYMRVKNEVIESLRNPLLPIERRNIILEVIEKDFALIWKFLESEKESGENE